MPAASTRSPFAPAPEEDAPWILWCSKSPVTALMEPKQTDRRSVFEEDAAPIQEPPLNEPPMLSRDVPHNRYNAVLARINQANRRAGGFSAWNA